MRLGESGDSGDAGQQGEPYPQRRKIPDRHITQGLGVTQKARD